MTSPKLTQALLLAGLLAAALLLTGVGNAQADNKPSGTYPHLSSYGFGQQHLKPDYCVAEGEPGYTYPAKTRVQRAAVDRRARALDMLAPITARASGRVKVKYEGDRRVDNFTASITSNNNTALDQIRFRKTLTRGQAALGQGIVTLSYPGDADTRPDEVRLRAASNPAKLKVHYMNNSNSHLVVDGSLTSKARGVVRFRYSYLDKQGQPQVHLAQTKVKSDGTWKLEYREENTYGKPSKVFGADAKLPSEAAECGGYLSILFTGYYEKGIRGEMLAYELDSYTTRYP